jgi:tRNA uridine 5-carboxymethylaminomethyl modification enzyme
MYDVIVIGAGHAGCEAALAAARLGCSTLLLSMNLDNVALMPCNPSIGGPAKGHLVREIDALGGEMARNTDRTFIQIRMLNTGKGPAVQALRAQADKKLYGLAMKYTLEAQPNLDLKQALVEELTVSDSVLKVKTNIGWIYECKTVVVTTGTSLAGRVIVGETAYPAGRAGEFAAYGLSQSLRNLGFTLGRLKTGTPPRINARTIDFSKTIPHPGSEEPLYFSFTSSQAHPFSSPPNPIYPLGKPIQWRQQLPCYLVYTNDRTHQIIRANLHRAPLYTGLIKGVGPRYCPSIEDKIVRFADKETHGLFLEPEGWQTNEVYVQGANTSLPEDVQLDMLRTVPALEHVEMMRVGYAIEYDYVPPSQTTATLESKLIPGLFFAGQINGTSGYEEAAAQGLIAGINAALKVKGKPALILRRDQAYIGVMIDDLVTTELTEPYRLMTSRAEYRLLLRQDNADLRLTPIGYQLGLVSEASYNEVEKKRKAIAAELKRLGKTHFSPGEELDSLLRKYHLPPQERSISALEFLRRPEVNYQILTDIGFGQPGLNPECVEQVEIETKYQGYIERQMVEVERVWRLEERAIPQGFDYDSITSFRKEAREKLKRFQPATLGQASRISGVTPADIAILLVHLEKAKCTK